MSHTRARRYVILIRSSGQVSDVSRLALQFQKPDALYNSFETFKNFCEGIDGQKEKVELVKVENRFMNPTVCYTARKTCIPWATRMCGAFKAATPTTNTQVLLLCDACCVPLSRLLGVMCVGHVLDGRPWDGATSPCSSVSGIRTPRCHEIVHVHDRRRTRTQYAVSTAAIVSFLIIVPRNACLVLSMWEMRTCLA